MQVRLLLVPALGATVVASTALVAGCLDPYATGFHGDPANADASLFPTTDAAPQTDFPGDAGGFDSGSLVQRPAFPSTTTAAVPPPPISGGTLLVTHDGLHVIAP